MQDIWRSCMDMMMGSGGMLMMAVMILLFLIGLILAFLGLRWLWRRFGSGMRSGHDPLQSRPPSHQEPRGNH